MLAPAIRTLPFLSILAIAGCASPSGGLARRDMGCVDGGCGCRADSDCVAAGARRCDPVAHACVACLADGDCPPGAVCAAHACAPGCSADHGCGDAGACEPDAGACVECLTDGDCRDPSRPRCDGALHLCEPCLPAGDNCGPGTYCAAQGSGFACAHGCKSDGDCAVDGGASAMRCDVANHTCVGCAADSDCPAGSVCGGGACVEGCTAQHGCPGAQACCGGRCADTTSDVLDCGGCGVTCAGGWSCCRSVCANPVDDAMNCGGCGVACAVQHGTPRCVQRACAIASCDAGWGDCDGSYADGCETDTATNPSNCGACGNACVIAHAQAGCVAGACAIDTCLLPYADCNGLLGDGCETLILGGDNTNCGGCGVACNPANATGQCFGGSCHVVSCAAGFGDCDGNPANGCEVPTGSSVANCGACNHACASENGVPSCVNGSCAIACNPGFGNCDGDVGNGCEANLGGDPNNCGACGHGCGAGGVCASGVCSVSCPSGQAGCGGTPCDTNLETDPKNCGACGNLCASINGTGTCSAGSCQFACVSPYDNCDGNGANGCETDLATDPLHCGGCGHACSTRNGTASCSNYNCSIACNANWGDCDNNVATGCETSLAGDVDNCGQCGYVCSSFNDTPLCVSGACQISCDSGFGDCDHNPVDGCESNLSVDPQNCGTCGLTCSANNITPSCGGGICNGVCASGFADCNGNKQVDGCESNLQSDPANCGACNHACSAGDSCVGGACRAPCGVKVNELVTGTPTGGASDEWVELWNSCPAGTAPISLSGWKLVYRSANNNSGGGDTTLYTFPSMTFAAQSYLLYVGNAYSGAATPDGNLLNGLAGAGGAVGVRDGQGNLVDSVAYQSLTVANYFTETAPAPNPPSGDSIARLPNGVDSNDNSADFSVSTTPTPRAANN